jgi:periplasmic divalent cation tolerance protein
MTDAEGYSLAMTTVGSAAQADELAAALVERRLAACVQLTPIVSHYVWDGAAQRSSETLLLIKTAAAQMAELRAFVEAHHPYDTPELIEVPIVSGLPAYLGWIDRSVG